MQPLQQAVYNEIKYSGEITFAELLYNLNEYSNHTVEENYLNYALNELARQTKIYVDFREAAVTIYAYDGPVTLSDMLNDEQWDIYEREHIDSLYWHSQRYTHGDRIDMMQEFLNSFKYDINMPNCVIESIQHEIDSLR